MAGKLDDTVRRRMAEALRGARLGMSGQEAAAALGISRITATKYLEVMAAQGLVRYKQVGNAAMWFADEDSAPLSFPEDYADVQARYEEMVTSHMFGRADSLVQNCMRWGADTGRMMTEVILPSHGGIIGLYNDGKIGGAELGLLQNAMHDSVRAAEPLSAVPEDGKNAILLASGPAGMLACHAAAASLKSRGWKAMMAGDMSSQAGVMLDLDLQKLAARAWKGRRGIMILAVFAGPGEGTDFLADASASAVSELGAGRARLAVWSPDSKRAHKGAALATGDLSELLQWCQTAYEGASKG